MFDCAFKPVNGERSIHYMGHVKMMAAAQPFLSGAISKTVNMPADTTVEEIAQDLHRGLEARAQVDRDLPRRLQAHPAAGHRRRGEVKKDRRIRRGRGRRRGSRAAASSPTRVQSMTHKFSVAGTRAT